MNYTCVHCSQTKQGKPWMEIRCPESPHSICSYLCYRASKDNYPQDLTPYVMNSQDFDFLFPIIAKPREPSFRLLKHDDFLQMTDAEIDAYYEEMDTSTIDPIRLAVHEEQEREDMRTRTLEYETYSDSSEDGY